MADEWRVCRDSLKKLSKLNKGVCPSCDENAKEGKDRTKVGKVIVRCWIRGYLGHSLMEKKK